MFDVCGFEWLRCGVVWCILVQLRFSLGLGVVQVWVACGVVQLWFNSGSVMGLAWVQLGVSCGSVVVQLWFSWVVV